MTPLDRVMEFIKSIDNNLHTEDELDTAVQGVALQIGWNINHTGWEAQVKFLLTYGWTADQIIENFKRRHVGVSMRRWRYIQGSMVHAVMARYGQHFTLCAEMRVTRIAYTERVPTCLSCLALKEVEAKPSGSILESTFNTTHSQRATFRWVYT